MQMVVQASGFHEIVEEEVASRRHRVTAQTHDIPVLDVAKCLQLCLKLMDVLRVVVEQLLDGNGVTILEGAFVYCA